MGLYTLDTLRMKQLHGKNAMNYRISPHLSVFWRIIHRNRDIYKRKVDIQSILA